MPSLNDGQEPTVQPRLHREAQGTAKAVAKLGRLSFGSVFFGDAKKMNSRNKRETQAQM